ncbi:MAG: hypothetical protein EI684_06015 [Candidatus Viridilinea halotolerans]|uniref:Uncharacterized protein n=1 Tax=Candidatus Viridilinea halotolerans TaxID=2491704 RepID=A0A426U4Q0_9CHLR|nr:MAG: hypothetical protein EI684_06015 [Candidatus Viridilinea halotolerans]
MPVIGRYPTHTPENIKPAEVFLVGAYYWLGAIEAWVRLLRKDGDIYTVAEEGRTEREVFPDEFYDEYAFDDYLNRRPGQIGGW